MGLQIQVNFSRLKSSLFSLNPVRGLTLSVVRSVHYALFLQTMSSEGTDLFLKFSFYVMCLH